MSLEPMKLTPEMRQKWIDSTERARYRYCLIARQKDGRIIHYEINHPEFINFHKSNDREEVLEVIDTQEPPKYPEHERMAAVKDKSQAIGEFLDSLSQQGIVLCKYQATYRDELDFVQSEGYYPESVPIEKRLAEYFGIDLAKIEAEKRAMLDAIRERNNGTKLSGSS